MSLSAMLKEHHQRTASRKEEQEKRKREAIAAASEFSSALVDHLNVGVSQAYINQKKLDTETRMLQSSVTSFNKQTVLWLKLVEDLKNSLKELGDVENWSKSIESDMKTVASALEYTFKQASQIR
ncbi:DgyrCDS6172 [Dimorphilus gyrociliatus]|uniref:Biogenesis of lysosome-related organelles complex 1 subunit 1 n=1 Tax=Dimorphilus gyrociliatus TaxID=2664684 RepID=A0A7I8VS25_9ANNE|nr:DgyrCDS6172 [Dimorphilus gyrociliatus]